MAHVDEAPRAVRHRGDIDRGGMVTLVARRIAAELHQAKRSPRGATRRG